MRASAKMTAICPLRSCANLRRQAGNNGTRVDRFAHRSGPSLFGRPGDHALHVHRELMLSRQAIREDSSVLSAAPRTRSRTCMGNSPAGRRQDRPWRSPPAGPPRRRRPFRHPDWVSRGTAPDLPMKVTTRRAPLPTAHILRACGDYRSYHHPNLQVPCRQRARRGSVMPELEES